MVEGITFNDFLDKNSRDNLGFEMTDEFFKQLEKHNINYYRTKLPSGQIIDEFTNNVNRYVVQTRKMDYTWENSYTFSWKPIIREIKAKFNRNEMPIFYTLTGNLVYDPNTFDPFIYFYLRYDKGFGIKKRRYSIYGFEL